MGKKNAVEHWALWNFDVLFHVDRTKRQCRDYANTLMRGGKEEADAMLRTGAFRITKVIVREI